MIKFPKVLKVIEGCKSCLLQVLLFAVIFNFCCLNALVYLIIKARSFLSQTKEQAFIVAAIGLLWRKLG